MSNNAGSNWDLFSRWLMSDQFKPSQQIKEPLDQHK